MANKEMNLMEKVVSLCKRRGFIFPGSELYGGLSGTWDYGPLGTELSHNIKELWWKHFVSEREDMYGVSTATIMSEAVWRASGHLSGFTDPMVECTKCHHRFRADHLENKNICPDCGGELGEEKTFNLLFPVPIGSVEGASSTAYLRGEIAQGMFVNFKNVLDTMRPKLPFGLAQIGKAYRNEIAPRDFIFRVREFDLMELEYFIRGSEWKDHFEMWRQEMWRWIDRVGIPRDMVHELEVGDGDRAHYSKRTIDFEFDYPFGRKELYGLAYRTDYDLKKHMEASGVDLTYGEEGEEKFVPHVIEPSCGHGRTMLALLCSAYTEDEMNGEVRAYLKLRKDVAPVLCAVSPLLKNKPELVEKSRQVYSMLKKEFGRVVFDDNGNVGKRYRRQDEIGTPYCIVIDFETLEGKGVTVRMRDTGEQERVSIEDLSNFLRNKE